MQRVRDGTRWMLRFSEGEDLFGALAEFATAEGIRAGVVVSGIGLLRKAVVGYWNGTQYVPKVLEEPHELVGLHGSLAVADDQPSIHLHAALGTSTHAVVGGHLLRATVGVMAEVYVESFPGRTFGRPILETAGLRVLDLDPAPNP